MLEGPDFLRTEERVLYSNGNRWNLHWNERRLAGLPIVNLTSRAFNPSLTCDPITITLGYVSWNQSTVSSNLKPCRTSSFLFSCLPCWSIVFLPTYFLSYTSSWELGLFPGCALCQPACLWPCPQLVLTNWDPLKSRIPPNTSDSLSLYSLCHLQCGP